MSDAASAQILDVVRPRRPSGGGWTFVDVMSLPNGSKADRWMLLGVLVLSAVEDAEYRGVVVPQFHISISCAGHRADRHAVRRALRDFGMTAAEEDNHGPGIARHFWLLVNQADGQAACECKDDEKTIVEPDGYAYQVPR